MSLVPLTVGTLPNEAGTSLDVGGVVHNIRILAQASPEVVLVHQSQMVGFYRVTGDGSEDIDPVSRSVKNRMLTGMYARLSR